MLTELELRKKSAVGAHSRLRARYGHGNISVRLSDGYLITQPMPAWDFLSRQTCKVDKNGVQQSGDRASKTLALHRRIYAADETASCVIHSHSTHLVTPPLSGVWSQRIITPITPYTDDESQT
jgi:ribulose-5-phosphate 4-epimerase/fuculose-1-phosphate aldolase